jgi:DNA-directed RNA polymerase subunit RPC12/RpoP
VTIREYTCGDCGKAKHQTGAGPKRVRCDECKRKRDAARKRRAKTLLAVVEEFPSAVEPVSPPVPASPLDPPPPSPPPAATSSSVRAAVVEVLAGLDSFGQVVPALRAMALSLADLMDTRPDLRPSASKELRSVLAELSPAEVEVDDDDQFFAGLSAPRSHPSAG